MLRSCATRSSYCKRKSIKAVAARSAGLMLGLVLEIVSQCCSRLAVPAAP